MLELVRIVVYRWMGLSRGQSLSPKAPIKNVSLHRRNPLLCHHILLWHTWLNVTCACTSAEGGHTLFTLIAQLHKSFGPCSAETQTVSVLASPLSLRHLVRLSPHALLWRAWAWCLEMCSCLLPTAHPTELQLFNHVARNLGADWKRLEGDLA